MAGGRRTDTISGITPGLRPRQLGELPGVPLALGSVAGAHVVLRPGAGVSKAELAAHRGRGLAGSKIPKQCTFVD